MNPIARIIISLGESATRILIAVGGMAQLAAGAFLRLFVRPFEFRATVHEIEEIGAKSAVVVGTLGMFIGMVLVVQTGYTLKRFGAEVYASEMVALAVVRELGPVLAGFLVAGRVGSGIAAEIGSMAISEQIDAMRSLGADPLKKIVLPKLIAGVIALPMLTAIADAISIIGGMIMAKIMLGVAPHYFWTRVQDSVTVGDFMSGVLKTTVFGAIIVIVACYHGLKTTGGTVGVGQSTTRSVVHGCVLILFADLALTTLFFAIGGIMTV